MKYKSFDEYWVIKGQFLRGGATEREIGFAAWNAAQQSVEAGQRPATPAVPKLPLNCEECCFAKMCRYLTRGCVPCQDAWRQLRAGA